MALFRRQLPVGFFIHTGSFDLAGANLQAVGAVFSLRANVALHSAVCRLERAKEQLKQMDMFETDAINENFRPANKVPYNFYYKFRDEAGTESRMRILDWEIGMLYWNCLKLAHNDQDEALRKVRQKYEEEFFQTDLHLFLGTTLEWHDRAPNPWMIVGVFPVPHQLQGELF